MTSGGVLGVIGLAFGVFAGIAWARAGQARANLRSKRADLPKAKKAVRDAWAGLWKTIGFAAAGVAVALIYVYASSTAATTSEDECVRDCPVPTGGTSP
jgi:hypothetical protein